MSKEQIQGNLARLLATENLTVEHRKIPTAYFDIEKRVLALPIWKDMNDCVYTMLVGHEIGHALYTPADEWVDEDVSCPKSFLNVIEDARIEKLVKRRYPGLKSQFFAGYKELHEKDFFEVADKDLNKLALIDRINLHFKVGSSMQIPFSDEELVFVERISNAETWQDVVEIANDLYDQVSSQQQTNPPEVKAPQSNDGGVPADQTVDNPSSNSPTENNETEESGEEDTPDPDLDTPSYSSDELNSITDEALARNQQQLIDEFSKENTYVELPKINLDHIIIPSNKITEHLTEWLNDESDDWRTNYGQPKWFDRYRTYKRESMQEVNYLVKEFEMKKSADLYRRSSTSRTGVLDTTKLHNYKFNDDIFKKVTSVTEGKNHGLVFYLDWSGSMAHYMEQTIRQLYSLIWFCQKTQIPYRVYAFTNSYVDRYCDPKDESMYLSVKENDIHFERCFRLLELFSSKMSARALDNQMHLVYRQCCSFTSYGSCAQQMNLGGTPLIEAVGSVPQILDLFNKQERVQKSNVIFLTDGEGGGLQTVSYYQDKICSYSTWYKHSNFIVRDRKKGVQQHMEVTSRERVNINLVSFVNKIVDANILCFRITAKRDLNSYVHQVTDYSIPVDVINSTWKKDGHFILRGYGFDEFYLLSNGSLDETDDFSAESENKTYTKREILTKFRKHMGKRRTNKAVLSNFVSQIA
jgi:hypothetical protein